MEWHKTISIHAPTRGATCYLCQRIHLIYNFNPRSYKRSDHIPCSRAICYSYFNPRSYKRSDLTDAFNEEKVMYFNPRSYKRSDLNALLKNPYVRLFQSTLLQEERRKYLRPYPRHLHFNPRSYKRSDAFSLFCQRILINISIHAPTRGATCVQFVPSKIWDISIHAPTRGATTRIILQQAICLFQSTLLQEERQAAGALAAFDDLFQSTLLQEERLFLPKRCRIQIQFQSTLLQEERPITETL